MILVDNVSVSTKRREVLENPSPTPKISRDPRDLEGRGKSWQISRSHGFCTPRPEGFPEGNPEGRGVQNPWPREISRAEGMDFPIHPESWWSTDILSSLPGKAFVGFSSLIYWKPTITNENQWKEREIRSFRIQYFPVHLGGWLKLHLGVLCVFVYFALYLHSCSTLALWSHISCCWNYIEYNVKWNVCRQMALSAFLKPCKLCFSDFCNIHL